MSCLSFIVENTEGNIQTRLLTVPERLAMLGLVKFMCPCRSQDPFKVYFSLASVRLMEIPGMRFVFNSVGY